MASEQQFFKEDEAEQILLLAARQSASGAMTREQLLAAAAEAGIAPEAVARAEAEYRERSAEVKERLEYDRHVKREFWGHLASYVIVNLGLVGIDVFTTGRLSWAYWSILGWGIGLAFHAWAAFAKGSEDYDKEYRKWRAKKSLHESGLVDEVSSGIVIGVKIGSMDGILTKGERKARAKLYAEEKKQEAIQHLRDRIGLSLPEAKEVVEEVMEENKG